MHAKIIAVYGLREEEISYISKNLPQKECEVMDTDDVADIIAVSEFAVIIRTEGLNKAGLEMLFEFYSEIAPFSESVIMIGNVEIPGSLKNGITVYEDFDSAKANLKYLLLSAYRKQKKTENFSATLANAITILSLIRKKPYITSTELANQLELSQRSIQRYIETLRVAGEWIEYDTTNKGWKLQTGKSVLWGDFGYNAADDKADKISVQGKIKFEQEKVEKQP